MALTFTGSITQRIFERQLSLDLPTPDSSFARRLPEILTLVGMVGTVVFSGSLYFLLSRQLATTREFIVGALVAAFYLMVLLMFSWASETLRKIEINTFWWLVFLFKRLVFKQPMPRRTRWLEREVTTPVTLRLDTDGPHPVLAWCWHTDDRQSTLLHTHTRETSPGNSPPPLKDGRVDLKDNALAVEYTRSTDRGSRCTLELRSLTEGDRISFELDSALLGNPGSLPQIDKETIVLDAEHSLDLVRHLSDIFEALQIHTPATQAQVSV